MDRVADDTRNLYTKVLWRCRVGVANADVRTCETQHSLTIESGYAQSQGRRFSLVTRRSQAHQQGVSTPDLPACKILHNPQLIPSNLACLQACSLAD